MNQPTFIPAPPRRIRRRKSSPRGESVSPLTLVGADYVPEFATVTLTFNAPINTDALVLETITLIDPDYAGETFVAYTTVGQTPDSVTVELQSTGPITGGGVTLTVEAGNGIVPAAGGAAWAGVEALPLPFGA